MSATDASDLVRYIRRLVDIPSVSGSEGDLARELARDLGARGFEAELQEVEGDRFNVRAGAPGIAPRVVLNTHLDTVPPFIASSEDDAFVYGRGACDAKGIIAAMVFAAEGLHRKGVRDVGLLFVVGEEVDGIGALAADRLGSGSAYVVVGEPTESRMASGHKGGFKFRLKARGKAAHSAYPHLGESAIERLLDGLTEIRREDWGRSETLGDATVNVGTISGGVAANVLAPEASADVFVRVVGAAAEVQAKLEAILARHEALDYELVSQSDAVSCETLPGYDVAPVSFGTDIPSFTRFGKPLLMGPGSIHDAHTAGEKIGKEEAVRAVDYYQEIATQLLERAGN